MVIKRTVLTDKFYLFHLANVHYNSELAGIFLSLLKVLFVSFKVKHRREKDDVS